MENSSFKSYYYLSAKDLPENQESKKRETTSLSSEETEKDVARFLISLLCRTKGKEKLRNIIDKQYKTFKRFDILTREDYIDFLKRYPKSFIIRYGNELGTNCDEEADKGEGTSDNDIEVEVTTEIHLCQTHVRKHSACPEDGECGFLHICKFWLLSGRCHKIYVCRYAHQLWTDHNVDCLKVEWKSSLFLL